MELAPERVVINYHDHMMIMSELDRLRTALDEIILDRKTPEHILDIANRARDDGMEWHYAN